MLLTTTGCIQPYQPAPPEHRIAKISAHEGIPQLIPFFLCLHQLKCLQGIIKGRIILRPFLKPPQTMRCSLEIGGGFAVWSPGVPRHHVRYGTSMAPDGEYLPAQRGQCQVAGGWLALLKIQFAFRCSFSTACLRWLNET